MSTSMRKEKGEEVGGGVGAVTVVDLDSSRKQNYFY